MKDVALPELPPLPATRKYKVGFGPGDIADMLSTEEVHTYAQEYGALCYAKGLKNGYANGLRDAFCTESEYTEQSLAQPQAQDAEVREKIQQDIASLEFMGSSQANAMIGALKQVLNYFDIPSAALEQSLAQPSHAASPDVMAMVNRFLSWELPKSFNPDCGISFDGRKDDDRNKGGTWPIGTNLFTSGEAKAMFEHALAGIAQQPAQEISVDVSTCDTDAGNRIFAQVIGVQDGVILAEETSRNFGPARDDTCPNCGVQDWRDFYTGNQKTHDVCASCDYRRVAHRPAQAAAPNTIAATLHYPERLSNSFLEAIVLDICEIPDRNSPEDMPEGMIVTADELKGIIRSNEQIFHERGESIVDAPEGP